MFDIKKDIQAMTTFRRNPAKFLKQLKKDEKTADSYHQRKGRSGCAIRRSLSAVARYSGASRRFGRYPPRPRRWEKRPRPPGARSPGNASARPCHTSLGLPSAPCATWKPFTNPLKRIVLNRLRPGSRNFPRRFTENKKLRHLLSGGKPNIYRIIYAVDKRIAAVNVLHIRHGARTPLATK